MKALLHCGTTSGLWHKPKDNCIQYKLKNKKYFDLNNYKQEVLHYILKQIQDKINQAFCSMVHELLKLIGAQCMFNNSNNKVNSIKSMNKFYNIIMNDEYVQKKKE